MAVTQYIGARYVPKFYENSDNTAAWRAGVEYEPLTIVTYNGNSYTSKKPVPASVGNPSDNPVYWAATGLYNEQIAALTQEVGGLSDAVDTLDSKIDSMTAGYVVCVGDSYVTGTREGVSWANYICSTLRKTLNTDFFIVGESGKGFTTVPVNFRTMLQEFVEDGTIDDLSKVSLVIFGGGANDIFDGAIGNVVSMTEAAIRYAKNSFPNARVCVSNTNGWITEQYGWQRREDLTRYYSTACAHTGAQFLGANGVGCILFPGTFLESDEKHPTAAGGTDIGTRMMCRLMGYDLYSGPMTSDGITYRERNDSIFFWWGSNKTYVLPEAVPSLVCNGATEIDLPTSTALKQSNSGEYFMINGAIRAGGTWHMCNMRARLGFNTIKVSPWILDGSGNPTYENIDWISVAAGNGGRITAHTIG